MAHPKTNHILHEAVFCSRMALLHACNASFAPLEKEIPGKWPLVDFSKSETLSQFTNIFSRCRMFWYAGKEEYQFICIPFLLIAVHVDVS